MCVRRWRSEFLEEDAREARHMEIRVQACDMPVVWVRDVLISGAD